MAKDEPMTIKKIDLALAKNEDINWREAAKFLREELRKSHREEERLHQEALNSMLDGAFDDD